MYTQEEAVKKIQDIVSNTDAPDIMKLVRRSISKQSIDKMNNIIKNCNDCELNSPFKTIGYGNPNASVMMICDYPLQDQLEASKVSNKNALIPFEGNDALLSFDRFFDAIGVNKDELFWMNSMNCYPTLNGNCNYRCPNSKEIKYCSTFVKYAVDIIKPSVIVLIGAVALNCFKDASMNSAHGKWIDAFTIPAMPIYSPAYLNSLKGVYGYPEDKINIMKVDMVKDLKKVFKYIQDNFPNNNVLTKHLDN